MLWIKNGFGKPDAMLSFSLIAVCVTSLSIILSLLSKITVAGVTIDMVHPDTTLILGFLSSTLGAYVIRRNNIFARPDQNNGIIIANGIEKK